MKTVFLCVVFLTASFAKENGNSTGKSWWMWTAQIGIGVLPGGSFVNAGIDCWQGRYAECAINAGFGVLEVYTGGISNVASKASKVISDSIKSGITSVATETTKLSANYLAVGATSITGNMLKTVATQSAAKASKIVISQTTILGTKELLTETAKITVRQTSKTLFFKATNKVSERVAFKTIEKFTESAFSQAIEPAVNKFVQATGEVLVKEATNYLEEKMRNRTSSTE